MCDKSESERRIARIERYYQNKKIVLNIEVKTLWAYNEAITIYF